MGEESREYATPRWVKVFALVALVAVVVLAVVLVAGGRHGPSRHATMPAHWI